MLKNKAKEHLVQRMTLECGYDRIIWCFCETLVQSCLDKLTEEHSSKKVNKGEKTLSSVIGRLEAMSSWMSRNSDCCYPLLKSNGGWIIMSFITHASLNNYVDNKLTLPSELIESAYGSSYEDAVLPQNSAGQASVDHLYLAAFLLRSLCNVSKLNTVTELEILQEARSSYEKYLVRGECKNQLEWYTQALEWDNIYGAVDAALCCVGSLLKREDEDPPILKHLYCLRDYLPDNISDDLEGEWVGRLLIAMECSGFSDPNPVAAKYSGASSSNNSTLINDSDDLHSVIKERLSTQSFRVPDGSLSLGPSMMDLAAIITIWRYLLLITEERRLQSLESFGGRTSIEADGIEFYHTISGNNGYSMSMLLHISRACIGCSNDGPMDFLALIARICSTSNVKYKDQYKYKALHKHIGHFIDLAKFPLGRAIQDTVGDLSIKLRTMFGTVLVDMIKMQEKFKEYISTFMYCIAVEEVMCPASTHILRSAVQQAGVVFWDTPKAICDDSAMKKHVSGKEMLNTSNGVTQDKLEGSIEVIPNVAHAVSETHGPICTSLKPVRSRCTTVLGVEFKDIGSDDSILYRYIAKKANAQPFHVPEKGSALELTADIATIIVVWDCLRKATAALQALESNNDNSRNDFFNERLSSYNIFSMSVFLHVARTCISYKKDKWNCQFFSGLTEHMCSAPVARYKVGSDVLQGCLHAFIILAMPLLKKDELNSVQHLIDARNKVVSDMLCESHGGRLKEYVDTIVRCIVFEEMVLHPEHHILRSAVQQAGVVFWDTPKAICDDSAMKKHVSGKEMLNTSNGVTQGGLEGIEAVNESIAINQVIPISPSEPCSAPSVQCKGDKKKKIKTDHIVQNATLLELSMQKFVEGAPDTTILTEQESTSTQPKKSKKKKQKKNKPKNISASVVDDNVDEGAGLGVKLDHAEASGGALIDIEPSQQNHDDIAESCSDEDSALFLTVCAMRAGETPTTVRCDPLKEECFGLKSKPNTIKKEKSSIAAERHALADQVSCLRKELQALEKCNESLQDENQDLCTANSDLFRVNGILKCELDFISAQSQSKYDALTATTRKLESRIKAVAADRENAVEQYSTLLAEQISRLTEELQTLKNHNKSLQGKNQDLSKTNSDLLKENGVLQVNLKKASTESRSKHDALTAAACKLESKLEAVRADRKIVIGERDQLAQQLQTLEKHNKSLQERNGGLSKTNSDLLKENGVLQVNLKKASTESQSKYDALTAAAACKLESKLEAVRADRRIAVAKHDKLARQPLDLDQEVQHPRESNKFLQEKSRALRDELHVLSAKLKAASGELGESTKENGQLREQNAQQSVELNGLTALRQQLEGVRQENLQLRRQNAMSPTYAASATRITYEGRVINQDDVNDLYQKLREQAEELKECKYGILQQFSDLCQNGSQEYDDVRLFINEILRKHNEIGNTEERLRSAEKQIEELKGANGALGDRLQAISGEDLESAKETIGVLKSLREDDKDQLKAGKEAQKQLAQMQIFIQTLQRQLQKHHITPEINFVGGKWEFAKQSERADCASNMPNTALSKSSAARIDIETSPFSLSAQSAYFAPNQTDFCSNISPAVPMMMYNPFMQQTVSYNFQHGIQQYGQVVPPSTEVDSTRAADGQAAAHVQQHQYGYSSQ